MAADYAVGIVKSDIQSAQSGLQKASTKPPADAHEDTQNGEAFGFADFIDIINPLQHIPVVSTVYRAITGDEIKPGARLIGGTLLGGPIGFAVASANVASEMATGKDIGEQVIAMAGGEDTAPSSPTDFSAEPEIVLAQNTPTTQGFPDHNPSPNANAAGHGTVAPKPVSHVATNPSAPHNPAWLPTPPSAKAALAARQAALAQTTSPAIEPKPLQPVNLAQASQPLVGPRNTSSSNTASQFLPAQAHHDRLELSPIRPSVRPVLAQPGALALAGPLSLPLQAAPDGIESSDEKQQERVEERRALNRREAALAIDRALRQAAEQARLNGDGSLNVPNGPIIGPSAGRIDFTG